MNITPYFYKYINIKDYFVPFEILCGSLSVSLGLFLDTMLPGKSLAMYFIINIPIGTIHLLWCELWDENTGTIFTLFCLMILSLFPFIS